MKSLYGKDGFALLSFFSLLACLALPVAAKAQDPTTARVLRDVCRPFAVGDISLSQAVAAAGSLGFSTETVESDGETLARSNAKQRLYLRRISLDDGSQKLVCEYRNRDAAIAETETRRAAEQAMSNFSAVGPAMPASSRGQLNWAGYGLLGCALNSLEVTYQGGPSYDLAPYVRMETLVQRDCPAAGPVPQQVFERALDTCLPHGIGPGSQARRRLVLPNDLSDGSEEIHQSADRRITLREWGDYGDDEGCQVEVVGSAAADALNQVSAVMARYPTFNREQTSWGVIWKSDAGVEVTLHSRVPGQAAVTVWVSESFYEDGW